MSQERAQILIRYAMEHDNRISSDEAYTLLSHFYYCNAGHYISMIFTRLVRSGAMIRHKRGHFELVSAKPIGKADAALKDHPTLF